MFKQYIALIVCKMFMLMRDMNFDAQFTPKEQHIIHECYVIFERHLA